MTQFAQLISGIILLSIFSLEVPKRAFRLYEKGDIEKTVEALDKSLEKDQLNPAANYLYATLFVDTAFSRYNIDSAFIFVNRGIANFKKIVVAKELEELKEVGVDSIALEALKDRIDALKFEVIKSKHTIAHYNTFLQTHFDAKQIFEAIALRDRIAFEDASAINSWEAYLAFITEYPRAIDFTEAKYRYEKLLYEDKTADGKRKSLISFLENYPETPYRDLVVEKIYEIETAINTITSYTDFFKNYPNQKLLQKSIPRLYHLFKEQFPNSDFFEQFKVEAGIDSLRKVEALSQAQLLPKLENGRINFIDQQGALVIKSDFTEVSTDCKCKPQLKDFVNGIKEGKSQIIGRNGVLIFEGDFDTTEDLGFGYIRIENELGQRLLFKSGEIILDQYFEEISVLNEHFIRTKKNGFYGLTTINKRTVLENEYVSIDTLGQFILLQREEGIALVEPDFLFPAIDGAPISPNFIYDEVEALENGDFLVFRNNQEALLSKALDVKIPLGEHEIYPKPYGWQIKTEAGITINHDKNQVIKNFTFDKLVENDRWLGVKQNNQWILIDQTGTTPPSTNYDSLGLWGENLVMLKKGQTTSAQFSNGRQIKIENGWEPTLLIPQNYISTGNKVEFDFLMLSNKKVRKIYNSFGREILSATYDEVVALDPNLLRLQKRNAALADSTGNYVLKFIYDGIGSNINGYVSTLDKGKVGLINTQKGINIPPDYDKQIDAYSDTILVATKGNGKGFINTTNQILSAFDYDEIQFFTEEVALARIENEWFLHRIRDESLLVEGILDFRLLNDSSAEKTLLITTENGKGIYSSVLKEVVPPTYTDIIVLGPQENPIYFAVKLVAEANIYVVIYYDRFGNKLFTQTFKQEEFFQIACPSN
ncbi:MAG: hypothetical protein COW03_17540 [Cytophagales bacterium CG12_big_fil_rev_8_21_14_0_65_40_12]|nr:MAG: hypothetical protein COW03_17540 [Cytophagales bacterium CG12_big_fil_rev_8_21_14_0_65_40_12]PIW06132.1 MAG: hypothetical protein COW40_00955 [Cytophagales bacterium CG17_big_fil_post_rev_8_21_14_2_50_40_13]